MFYSTYILQKKGPLAKIWIAAHWDKKLTKSDIKLVDISEIVVQLINPNVPIALRTSGELLYGVVRIFSDKVKFLLQEAQGINYRIRSLSAPTTAASSAVAGGPLASVTEKITLPGTSAARIPTGADLETTILPSDVADTIQARITMFPQSATATLEILRPADQIGDLDEWTLIPGEKPLDTSLEGFSFLPEDTERSPKPQSEASESSTTVSSTERLRIPRETPTAGATARRDDIHVAMSVEDLFKQQELTTPDREQQAAAGGLPIPSPFDISGAAGADVTTAAALPPAIGRPEKKRKLKIDTTTTLDDRHLKSRMEDTLDTIRPGSCFPKSLAAMRVKTLMQSDHETKMKYMTSEIVHGNELPEALTKTWRELAVRVKPTLAAKPPAAAAATEEETEVIRRERERASMGAGAGEFEGGLFPLELGGRPSLPGSEGGSGLSLPPMTEMELKSFELRKRRAEELMMEAKRRRLEPGSTAGAVDLGQTNVETLARLRKLCKPGQSISFSQLTRKNTRRNIATQFYDLLVLKSTDQIEVSQATPYGEIIITL